MTKEQFETRLRELGFVEEGGKILLGAKKYGSSRVFYREYLEWSEGKQHEILTHDEFVVQMTENRFVVVASVKADDEGWDHFLAMPRPDDG